MGIHDEPGIWRDKLKPADAITDEVIDRILADRPFARGDRVSVLVNSLCATPLEKLYIIVPPCPAAL
ncbi:dihydroxyacetone kinase subunit DhaK [Aurantimonas sp. A2-1-M11]